MIWTDERTALLKAYKKEGLSHAEIAHRLGVTRNTVCGKLNRLGLVGPCKTPYKARRGPDKVPRSSWDHVVFESWSDRKARLAAGGRV